MEEDKSGKRHTLKKTDMIDNIIQMRLKQGKSRESIFNTLMKEFRYSQSYSYELIRDAAREFESRAAETFAEDLKMDIAKMEELYEKAFSRGDFKEARETLKEISKLKGHYKERIELSGDLNHNVNVIRLIEIKPDGSRD